MQTKHQSVVTVSIVLAALLFVAGVRAAEYGASAFHAWAPTPPMGWNSWDCFATTISEAQARETADIMAEKLLPHGWRYLVIDHQWFESGAKGFQYRKRPVLAMDEFGRLQPSTNRFPSAAGGAGFKPLADYVHAKGLKFGVHIMRGIARQAVEGNTPVAGTGYHARDIADTNSTCSWCDDMYGVDMSRPGAQEYYDTRIRQYAEWGVDFIKVDDLSRPYHQQEIEAVRKAIDKCGRPIVFSTSPGATPLAQGGHVGNHANMWRISDDFWDKWSELKAQFKRLHDWTPHRLPGAYPDADMLPLGTIGMGRATKFTPAEQRTMMSLWCIARSPLMLGSDLTRLDGATLALLTNDEVLAISQYSTGNRQVSDERGMVVWTAWNPAKNVNYVALFNTTDTSGTATVGLADLGVTGPVGVRDLWAGTNGVPLSGSLAVALPAHGSALYRLEGRADNPSARP